MVMIRLPRDDGRFPLEALAGIREEVLLVDLAELKSRDQAVRDCAALEHTHVKIVGIPDPKRPARCATQASQHTS